MSKNLDFNYLEYVFPYLENSLILIDGTISGGTLSSFTEHRALGADKLVWKTGNTCTRGKFILMIDEFM